MLNTLCLVLAIYVWVNMCPCIGVGKTILYYSNTMKQYYINYISYNLKVPQLTLLCIHVHVNI